MSKGIVEKPMRLSDNIELLTIKEVQIVIDEILTDILGDDETDNEVETEIKTEIP